MFGIGVPEFVIILLAFGLLFFGSQKISDFARGLGRVSGEFKKGKKEIEKELMQAEQNSEQTTKEEVKKV